MCRKLGKKHDCYTNRAANKRDKDGKMLRAHNGQLVTRHYGYNSLDAWTDMRDKFDGGQQWSSKRLKPSKQARLDRLEKIRNGIHGRWTNWANHNDHFLRNHVLPGDCRGHAYELAKRFTTEAAYGDLPESNHLTQVLAVGRGIRDIDSNIFAKPSSDKFKRVGIDRKYSHHVVGKHRNVGVNVRVNVEGLPVHKMLPVDLDKMYEAFAPLPEDGLNKPVVVFAGTPGQPFSPSDLEKYQVLLEEIATVIPKNSDLFKKLYAEQDNPRPNLEAVVKQLDGILFHRPDGALVKFDQASPQRNAMCHRHVDRFLEDITNPPVETTGFEEEFRKSKPEEKDE